MKKKYFLIIFLLVFLAAADFSLASLEITYPQLPTGETISPANPLTGYVKYLFNFGILLGIIAAVFMVSLGGFLYVTSAGRPASVKNARDRIWRGISGLILLLTFYLIISAINPELTFLRLTPLKETPGLFLVGGEKKRPLGLIGISDVSRIKPPKSSINFSQIEYTCPRNQGPILTAYFYKQPKKVELYKQTDLNCGQRINIEGGSFDFRYKSAGVYLYTKSSCQVGDPPPAHHINNIPDLGDLKNRINSVKISQLDPNYYIAFLYELINYQGTCYQIEPNTTSCDDLNRKGVEGQVFGPTGSSVSIYKYSFEPSGDGITFYRKPDFNPSGGFFKVKNNEIIVKDGEIITKGGYVGNLKELYYTSNGQISGECNVPLEDRICVEWDQNIEGKCVKRVCPNLAGGGCAEWEGGRCKKPLDSSGPNVSSIEIKGNYFVMLVYFDPLKDSPNGKWTYCQGFPTANDADKQGPKQIKWEYIQRAQNIPNFVVIIPVKEK